MWSVIVILEWKLLQMLKQVFSYIVNNILADVNHDPASDRGKHNADHINAGQNTDKRK